MIPRTFSWIFIGLMLGLAVMGFYNVRLDLYGVFSGGYRSYYDDMAPNYHFLKTRYILSRPARFDCLVMGSSRVAGVDAGKLGERCYNMTHSGGTPVQHLHDLKLFIEGGVELETLYIGVDDLAYTWDNDSNDKHYRRRAYPASAWEWLGFYSMYLFRWLEKEDIEVMEGVKVRTDQPYWVMTEGSDGKVDSRGTAEEMYANPERRRAELAKMNPTIWFRDDRVDETLQALEDIFNLAKQHGIEVRVFFNPMHFKTYLVNDWEMMLRFKTGLAELVSYRDFSGFNAVTLDDRYWIETSHYSVLAGDRMVDALLGDTSNGELLGRELGPGLVRPSYEADIAKALSLFPDLVGRQSGLYLPVPVADILVEGLVPENLLTGSTFTTNEGVIVSESDGGFKLSSRTRDPQVRFRNRTVLQGGITLLSLDFSVPSTGYAEIYYSGPNGKFSRKNRMLYRSGAGRNRIIVPLPAEWDISRLRLDPGRDAGIYYLNEALLYRLPAADAGEP